MFMVRVWPPFKFKPFTTEINNPSYFFQTVTVARKVVGPGLQPIQTGGGLRCGVEFGARMADLAYRQGDAIIAVDIANAFNTVRHGPIFTAIIER